MIMSDTGAAVADERFEPAAYHPQHFWDPFPEGADAMFDHFVRTLRGVTRGGAPLAPPDVSDFAALSIGTQRLLFLGSKSWADAARLAAAEQDD